MFQTPRGPAPHWTPSEVTVTYSACHTIVVPWWQCDGMCQVVMCWLGCLTARFQARVLILSQADRSLSHHLTHCLSHRHYCRCLNWNETEEQSVSLDGQSWLSLLRVIPRWSYSSCSYTWLVMVIPGWSYSYTWLVMVKPGWSYGYTWLVIWLYSETWELGTHKGLWNTVLNSEVVFFRRPISM